MKSNSLSEDFTAEEKELIMVSNALDYHYYCYYYHCYYHYHYQVSNALVMFFAGFDSTAISLSKIAHKMVLHPDVQDKVLQEIEDTLGEEDEVTPDNVNQLKYMEQVINESLRHEDILTSHERMCTKDYLIPGTTMTIPKGRVVKVYFTKMELDEKNFKNPHNFDPENFAPENDHNKFAFMPFSQGPRKCIGIVGPDLE